MLPAIEVTINVLWIPLICILFAFAGYIFRRSQLNKLRQHIGDLEKEILQNHAEILGLQKENILLEDKMKNNPVPVIPITSKENNPENLPDGGSRKKLLGKTTSNQHS